MSIEKWSLSFESSNIRQDEYQVKFGEKREISVQELIELGLSAREVAQISINILERLMDS